jgi:hypothetical protein
MGLVIGDVTWDDRGYALMMRNVRARAKEIVLDLDDRNEMLQPTRDERARDPEIEREERDRERERDVSLCSDMVCFERDPVLAIIESKTRQRDGQGVPRHRHFGIINPPPPVAPASLSPTTSTRSFQGIQIG